MCNTREPSWPQTPAEIATGHLRQRSAESLAAAVGSEAQPRAGVFGYPLQVVESELLKRDPLALVELRLFVLQITWRVDVLEPSSGRVALDALADASHFGSKPVGIHELPNVIVTPHNSGWTQGMVRRRWDEIADNINRFARGDSLINVVATI